MKHTSLQHEKAGEMSAPTTAGRLTFRSLPVGAHFRWQSNLGGQDLLLKVSATELRNLKTGNRYEPKRETHYFGADDSVLRILNQEPNPFNMAPD